MSSESNLKNNMKKQFFRIKQQVDQTFTRSDKSDAPEDLVTGERRLESLKSICNTLNKKIPQCFIGQNRESNEDKKMRKMPDMILGIAMTEATTSMFDNSPLKAILSTCGIAQQDICKRTLTYESKVENEVLIKIVEFMEAHNPQIDKQKKHLGKLTLEMNATRARLNALKAGKNTTPDERKVVEEELECATIRVEQCRDGLVADIFTLLSKEAVIAGYVKQFLQEQHDYHRDVMLRIESQLPALNAILQSYPIKPVFGCGLVDHLRSHGIEIAEPIKHCVSFLHKFAIQEEGLFRATGSASKMKKLKAAFDGGLYEKLDWQEYLRDFHAVAGVLKSYLRELPIPLMTHELYDEWMGTIKSGDMESKVEALKNVAHRLPKDYYVNLRFLMRFLSILSSNQEVNKMSSQNIAIVMAINLIWAPDDPSGDMLGVNRLTNVHTAIVEILISNAETIFPEHVDFGDFDLIKSDSINGSGKLIAAPDVIPSQFNYSHTANGEDEPAGFNSPLSPTTPVYYNNSVSPTEKVGSPKMQKKRPAPGPPPGIPSNPPPVHYVHPATVYGSNHQSAPVIPAPKGKPALPQKPPPLRPDKKPSVPATGEHSKEDRVHHESNEFAKPPVPVPTHRKTLSNSGTSLIAVTVGNNSPKHRSVENLHIDTELSDSEKSSAKLTRHTADDSSEILRPQHSELIEDIEISLIDKNENFNENVDFEFKHDKRSSNEDTDDVVIVEKPTAMPRHERSQQLEKPDRPPLPAPVDKQPQRPPRPINSSQVPASNNKSTAPSQSSSNSSSSDIQSVLTRVRSFIGAGVDEKSSTLDRQRPFSTTSATSEKPACPNPKTTTPQWNTNSLDRSGRYTKSSVGFSRNENSHNVFEERQSNPNSVIANKETYHQHPVSAPPERPQKPERYQQQRQSDGVDMPPLLPTKPDKFPQHKSQNVGRSQPDLVPSLYPDLGSLRTQSSVNELSRQQDDVYINSITVKPTTSVPEKPTKPAPPTAAPRKSNMEDTYL